MPRVTGKKRVNDDSDIDDSSASEHSSSDAAPTMKMARQGWYPPDGNAYLDDGNWMVAGEEWRGPIPDDMKVEDLGRSDDGWFIKGPVLSEKVTYMAPQGVDEPQDKPPVGSVGNDASRGAVASGRKAASRGERKPVLLCALLFLLRRLDVLCLEHIKIVTIASIFSCVWMG